MSFYLIVKLLKLNVLWKNYENKTVLFNKENIIFLIFTLHMYFFNHHRQVLFRGHVLYQKLHFTTAPCITCESLFSFGDWSVIGHQSQNQLKKMKILYCIIFVCFTASWLDGPLRDTTRKLELVMVQSITPHALFLFCDFDYMKIHTVRGHV